MRVWIICWPVILLVIALVMVAAVAAVVLVVGTLLLVGSVRLGTWVVGLARRSPRGI